ncbi:MAG TPA: lysophospholipid acyltransferase family protein [Candidatus Limnocylindria bacterium]|nr:lysophospholipid acyltransferase family protein [Candidatus Limnocylindria bacterium]
MTADGRGPPAPFLIRLAAALARAVLSSVARVRVEVAGELPRQGPLIVVANHLSNADPPLVVGWLTPLLGRQMHILAKEALFVGPVGTLLRSQGVTPVRAGGSDMEAYRAARAVLERGEVLCIFPEGTRSRTGHLGQARPGVAMLATRLGVPILPVGISGSERFLPPGARLPRLGTRIRLRVGRPFRLQAAGGVSRRQAVEAGAVEIMRRLAGLVAPPNRGPYDPLLDTERAPE